MRSQLAKSVLETLTQALPNTLVKEEEYVSYKGQRLFFDFYLPSLNIYVEVQGVQHTEFNSHFHGDAASFRAAKQRDRLKKEWIDLNDFTLVCVNHDEVPMTPETMLARISEAQNG